jgi:hypothetical protein
MIDGITYRYYFIHLSATLQQSSNIFYQKFVKIVSSGGCGEEKGFKGKGNRRSRLRPLRVEKTRALGI